MTDEAPMRMSDEWLADQVARLADRIARGETPELGESEASDWGDADALKRLLPTIRLLSALADEDATEDRPPSFTRPAEILGDFRLVREIGRGGIGVVYEATQISLGRRVALKVLPPTALLNVRQLRRFETEARAAAFLQHPNIVPVFAYGTERGMPYFAMRLIDGRNLAEIVADLRERQVGGVPPREVAELGRQGAEALDYAHRNDVLHGDIKPANLLVDQYQRLWIADFGLARIRSASDSTAGGDVLGSVRYRSPEQANGRHEGADCRSDVYSLGATLYELLTLRPLYEGDDLAELLIRIRTSEPRFSRKLDAAIPADLKTIVLKALANDPAERYETAGALAADLTLFLARQPIQARPPTRLSRLAKLARRYGKSLAAVGLLTVVILLGMVAAGFWSNSRLRALNQRLAAEADRAQCHAREALDHARQTGRHALGAQLRLAAQALDAAQPERAQEVLREVPHTTDREAPRSFVWRYLWRRARRDIVLLAGPPARFAGMAPSPDGKRLATSDGSGGLQLWDLSSGTRVRDIDTAPNRAEAPTFSPDSTLLAAADSHAGSSSPDGFSIWEVATGRRLTRLPMEPRFSGLRGAFLPGEGFLGFGSGAETSPESVGQLWSLADDRSKPRLLERFERPTNMDSVAAGGGLVTLETDSRLLLRDVRTGKGTRHFDVKTTSQIVKAYACARGEDVVAAVLSPGEKLNLWNGHTGELLASHQAPEGLAGLNFSPNGTTLAGVDMRGDVHLIDCVTGVTHRVRPEESDRARLARVVFSPDSARLATNVFVPGQAGSPVSIWQTGTGRRLATFSGRPEPVAQAEFTTDSQSLLILSKSGIRQWRLAPADDDTNRQPAGHEDEAWSLAFSPDGRMLATGGDDDSGPDPTVKLWDTTTGRLSRAWHGGHGTVAALAISPDGRTLATGHLVSTDNVRIWDTATGRLLTTLTGHADRVRTVAFPRDGGSLATAGSDGTVRLWDVRSWCVRTVFRGHGDTVHAVAYSPDGATLASAGDNGDLRLWDLRSNKGAPSPPRLFPGRSNLVAVAFAPDGKTLAVADDQGTMTVWDLERSTPLRLIQSEGGALCQVTYAPDGDALAAAGKDGLIRLWDPATGQELISLAAHRAPIHGLAFSPDGSTLGSVAHDGSVRLWRADP